ncbi:unnamed protein product [Rhodiola kirilowii]
MAQAARLSLRMQKELKLLLSDPPPGATFPYLASDSDHLTSSLTAIDAQIEGPKGTVYENGYFHIRIQIPERYPFQPPIVTFATPIYHPNIDTGGRICLDILNLPPKGAWQPSLNIPTMITSIGLLLSEPNPDDGLMCEASREYKYNRQAFDQKARSMTEKYAKALSGGSSSSNEGFLINSNSSQGEKTAFKDEVKSEGSYSKEQGISRKLSLQSSGSTENSNDKGLADQSISALLHSQVEIGYSTESKYGTCYSNINDGKLSGMRRKLSLEASCQSRKRSSDEKNTLPYVHQSSLLIPQTSQQIQRFGDSDLKCQDVGFDLGEKPPICKKVLADLSDNMQGDLINSSQMKQVIQPASTDFGLHVPKMSSLKSQAVACDELKPPLEDKNRGANDLSIPSYKQLFNKNLIMGYHESAENAKGDNKENIPQAALFHSTSDANYQPCQPSLVAKSGTGKHVNGRLVNSQISSSNQNQGLRKRLSLQPLKSVQANHNSNIEVKAQNTADINQQVRKEPEPPISSEVIVLDSDEEEDKDEPARSKLMLGRRRLCLAGKRKARR